MYTLLHKVQVPREQQNSNLFLESPRVGSNKNATLGQSKKSILCTGDRKDNLMPRQSTLA